MARWPKGHSFGRGGKRGVCSSLQLYTKPLERQAPGDQGNRPNGREVIPQKEVEPMARWPKGRHYDIL